MPSYGNIILFKDFFVKELVFALTNNIAVTFLYIYLAYTFMWIFLLARFLDVVLLAFGVCKSLLLHGLVFQFDVLGYTRHSIFAWKIPWMEGPGRLQSMGSRRVRHDWVISLSLFTFMHCRRKWQPTPLFLPGESQGQRRLVGCHLWGHTELDTTEVT